MEDSVSSSARGMWRTHSSVESLDARVLVEWMSNISEQQYFAGWLIGTEFALWSMLEGGSRDWGFGDVPERDIEDLRILSQRAGGWIVSDSGDDKEYDGKRLVSFAEWRELYVAHETAERSKMSEPDWNEAEPMQA